MRVTTVVVLIESAVLTPHYLRNILIMSQMGDMAEQSGVDDVNTQLLYEALKYAIIVVSAAPLLILYPFVQRFFEKGIMMGSIKG